MDAADARVVLVASPDAETARSLARTLVAERLAACGNVVSGVVSVYRWQGTVQENAEALLVLKTSREMLERLSARVTELHPYEVPEVLALDVAFGNEAYLEWLGACLAPAGGSDGT